MAEAEPVDPRLTRMRDAIAALPAKWSEVLQFRIRQELTYEEIAAVLDIPVGTVRSRLHAAVRRLRQRMSDAHDETIDA